MNANIEFDLWSTEIEISASNETEQLETQTCGHVPAVNPEMKKGVG
jgi:hypothetical protein